MFVWTEEQVRSLFATGKIKEKEEFILKKQQLITPSAREYLQEKNIIVKLEDTKVNGQMIGKEEVKKQKTIQIQTKEAEQLEKNPEGYDTLFGVHLEEKPEHMTHLRGNLLVFKDHPVIAFRGAIDSLESSIILFQAELEEKKKKELIEDLEEIIGFIRNMIRCEITGEDIGIFELQGLTAAQLREHSHHPSVYYGRKHFLPNYQFGRVVAYLNQLRTKTRETELIAFRAFYQQDGSINREDIIRGLNRLSSLFWIMMFKELDGMYKG